MSGCSLYQTKTTPLWTGFPQNYFECFSNIKCFRIIKGYRIHKKNLKRYKNKTAKNTAPNRSDVGLLDCANAQVIKLTIKTRKYNVLPGRWALDSRAVN